MRDLKSILIIVLLFLVPLIVLTLFGVDLEAKLSDDTLEIVNDLRWKHSGELTSFFDCETFYDGTIEWTRDFLSIRIEGDRLIIETQDGKWFIEMEKIEED